MPARKGQDIKIPPSVQSCKNAAGRCFGDAPSQCQAAAAGEGVAGAVSEIHNGTDLRPLYALILVDGIRPKVHEDVPFRTAFPFHQPFPEADGEKEKAAVLLTAAFILKHSIEGPPVQDPVMDQFSSGKYPKGEKALLSKLLQNRSGLVQTAASKPASHFPQAAEPFSGTDEMGDSVDPESGRSEIGIGAEEHKGEQAAVSPLGQGLIRQQLLDQLPVDSHPRIVHDLFDFQGICHIIPPNKKRAPPPGSAQRIFVKFIAAIALANRASVCYTLWCSRKIFRKMVLF